MREAQYSTTNTITKRGEQCSENTSLKNIGKKKLNIEVRLPSKSDGVNENDKIWFMASVNPTVCIVEGKDDASL